MARLIIEDGKGGRIEHELVDDVTTFGRSSNNIIQIKDEESSRQHFRVERAGDGFRLVDLGSRNGTKVNGVRVSGQALRAGDTITVGNYRITFDQRIEVGADELGATVAVDPGAAAAAVAASPAGQAAPAAAAARDPLSEAPPQFVLEVTEGPRSGTRIELGVDPVTMGRHSSNKLVIDDEAASNYHAEVSKEAIGYVVSDLGSTNGTRVNGEKVVKSPLAHGAKIKIGATVITFKNLGAPTAEDAVFGTVVLDSEKLDAELAAARRGGGAGRVLAAVVVVALAGLGAFAAARFFRQNGTESNGGKPAPVIGDVANPGFRDGTDADGNPKEWKVSSDHSRNRALVDPARGRETGKAGEATFSLRMQRDESARANSQIVCQQVGTFDVDAGSAYRAAAFVVCPGAQGIYGLRLTWVGADRRQMEVFSTISGAHPEWKEVELLARPPRWAGKLRLALVAFGNSGDVWFDDVTLRKVPADEAPDCERIVDYRGVVVALDTVGQLTVERGGLPALTGGEFVADGQGKVSTGQGLARPERGYPRAEGDRQLFRGSVYDFARGRNFGYEMSAGKGGDGVALSYSFSTSGEELTLDRLALRFTVEPAFAAAPEVYTTEGRKPLERGLAEHVSEMILKSPGKELVLSFGRPVTVGVEPRGERKELTIVLAQNPSLSTAPLGCSLELAASSARSVAERKSAFDAVQALFDGRNWRQLPQAARRARERFPEAADELARLTRIEAEFDRIRTDAQSGAERAVQLAERASSPEAHELAYAQGKEALARLQEEWAGTPLDEQLRALGVRLEETLNKRKLQLREVEAQSWLEKAKAPYNEKQWMLAEVYLKKVTTDYPGTQAAVSAKKLLDLCQQSRVREETIIKAEEDLLLKIRNYELNKQYAKAIEIIEKDNEFRRYGVEMKAVKRKLDELRALQEQ
jgi:pSer/pThr/pTyr-binding forkhead associated (FHA) protein